MQKNGILPYIAWKGEEPLAREIIDAIRQAETEAAARSASAAKEAERILKEAEEQAAALKKEMTKKALDEAGVPHIKLGVDQQMRDFGQANTAIQAFAEVL